MNSAKNVNGSSNGELYALRAVGPKPKTSTVVSMTTVHNGSEVKYQNGREDIAVVKNTQSVFVMVMSALFIYAINATYKVITPETPIGQAPTPP